mmetsp:Transcript_57540/g.68702  ORF Transcript_57540/g.68702 Transcript_57540/m.68702 type:complete len:150 (+) Transcript_57540:299-748(+)
MGTMVSAPVYDFLVIPPVLIGAIGINLRVDAMYKAMGNNDGGIEMLNMLIMQSTNTCSKLSLTDCKIENLCLSIGGVSLQCSLNCSNVINTTTAKWIGNNSENQSNKINRQATPSKKNKVKSIFTHFQKKYTNKTKLHKQNDYEISILL